jgi:mRNA export factor
MIDLGGNGQAQTVASHDAPIRVARFFNIPSANASDQMLVTGSWDKTVKYWDLRQSKPAVILECLDKIYSMDVSDQ